MINRYLSCADSNVICSVEISNIQTCGYFRSIFLMYKKMTLSQQLKKTILFYIALRIYDISRLAKVSKKNAQNLQKLNLAQ